MKINYIRTDSLNKDYIATDTLNFNIRKSIRGKRQESKGGAEEEQALKFLGGINSNVQSSFELYNPIRIEFAQPIVALDSSDVKLERAVDSLFEVVPYRMEHDSLNPRKFTLRPSWMPGESYRLTIDSAAILVITGYGTTSMNNYLLLNRLISTVISKYQLPGCLMVKMLSWSC